MGVYNRTKSALQGVKMKTSEIPFADFIGIEQNAKALSLPPRGALLNHLQTLHAGAQYTLAETQSGIYLQSLFPEYEGRVIPLLRDGSISYKTPASKTLYSHASCDDADMEAFRTQLEKRGRGVISITVTLSDADGVVASQSQFKWFVQKIKEDA